jgi:hypothetical protein
MKAAELPYALHGLLLVGAFLAWFYLPWQTYLIERGRARLSDVRDYWSDLVSADPRSRDDAACHAMRMVFDAQVRRLQDVSLPLVVLNLLFPSAEQKATARLVDSVVERLPDVSLRRDARRLQDAAIVQIGLVMIQRSLICWVAFFLLSPVVLFAAPSIVRYRKSRALQPFSEIELSIAIQQDADLPRNLRAAWR